MNTIFRCSLLLAAISVVSVTAECKLKSKFQNYSSFFNTSEVSVTKMVLVLIIMHLILYNPSGDCSNMGATASQHMTNCKSIKTWRELVFQVTWCESVWGLTRTSVRRSLGMFFTPVNVTFTYLLSGLSGDRQGGHQWVPGGSLCVTKH